MLDLTDIAALRTEKSQTWLTGKKVGHGLQERLTLFHAGPVFLPDLQTVVDFEASRLSGQDIVFDRLAGGAKITFDPNKAAYTMEKGGAAMRYESTEDADLISVDGRFVTYKRRSDGLPIVFNLSRSMARHYSDFDPAITQEPSFKRIADQKGIDAFAFLKPTAMDPGTLEKLLSGDVTFDQNGLVRSGFDLSKAPPGKVLRFDPSGAYNPAAGDGIIIAADGSAWLTARNAATGTPYYTDTAFYLVRAYDLGTKVNGRGFIPFDTSAAGAGAVFSAGSVAIRESSADGIVNVDGLTLHVVQASQASVSELVGGDYDNVAFSSGGSIALASISENAVFTVTLNGTGLGFFNPTGHSKLGFVFDIDINSGPPPTSINQMVVEFSEGTVPPVLNGTYTVPSPVGGGMILLGVG